MTNKIESVKSVRAGHLGPREMVAMMAMLMALNALAIDTMLPALPQIAASLGAATANDQQYIVTTYLVALGAGSLAYGPLADRFGRRRVLLGALGLYIVSALACSLLHDFTWFLAMRALQGIAGAALGVVVIAIIRDILSGDAMAKRMSMIFLVFMGVPIVAPAIGQLILEFGDWRLIFWMFAALGGVMLAWVALRLPETLDPADVTPISLRPMAASWRAVVLHRMATGYIFAGALLQGALYGYLASSHQIISEVFGAEAMFAIVFAVVAVGIAVSNFSNSRIVMRFGARRVSQTATIVYILVAAAQVAAALSGKETLWLFTGLMTLNVGLAGFTGSNFGAIAMEPFGHMAGVASSFQAFVRSIFAAVMGAVIGQMFDGSTLPLALGFLGAGCLALLLVWWAERGRLFTRPGTAPRSTVPPR